MEPEVINIIVVSFITMVVGYLSPAYDWRHRVSNTLKGLLIIPVILLLVLICVGILGGIGYLVVSNPIVLILGVVAAGWGFQISRNGQ